MAASTLKRVLKCAREMGIDETRLAAANLDTRFDALDMDSLDRVELMMELEDRFGYEIPDGVAEAWQTIGDVVRYLDGVGR